MASKAPSQDGLELDRKAMQLAQDLRAEIEARRSLLPQAPPLTDPVPPHFLNTLHAQGRLLDLPRRSRPGPLPWLVHMIRRILKVLLRPWLDSQTACNQAAAESLMAMQDAVMAARRELASLKADLGIGHWLADPNCARSNILLTLRNEMDMIRTEVAELSTGVVRAPANSAEKPR